MIRRILWDLYLGMVSGYEMPPWKKWPLVTTEIFIYVNIMFIARDPGMHNMR